MLTALTRRARSQAGQAQLTLTGIFAVLVLMVAAVATNSMTSVASPKVSPQARAENVLRYAGYTANLIAAAHGGSYDRVGLLNLHKVGGVRFVPSPTHAWVTEASGHGRTLQITVKAEPTGASYTLSRTPSGTRISDS